MKTLFTLLVILAIGGGGYYWYTSQEAPATPTPTDSFGMEAQGSNTDAMNADRSMQTSPTPTPTGATPPAGSAGVQVDANASVTTTGSVKEFTVTGKNFSFLPGTMTVKKGDRVRITFVNDSGTHDLVIDEFNARTKIIQGGARETIEFVADKTGSFEYYCSVGKHREMGMKGTLTVQ